MEAFDLVVLTDAGAGRVHGIDKAGNAYVSTDSGNAWTKLGALPLPRETLTHVVFTSPDTGYAGSVMSTVWRTVDGGRNWKQVFSDFYQPWKRLEFFGSRAGLGLTRQFLVRTGDAWTTPEIVRRDAQDMQVLDGSRAFLLAFDSLYASSDTGRTWNSLPWIVPPGGRTLGFQFADPRHGYIWVKAGRAGTRDTVLTLYRTHDGGATWSAAGQSTRRPNQLPPPPLARILFRDSLQGITWETSEDEGRVPSFRIFWTGDGGRTWMPADTGTSAAVSGAFSRGRGGDLWILESGGAMARSRDAGRSWERLGGGPARTFRPVHFRDRLRGVAIRGIANGTLCRSRDGGRTWRAHPGAAGIPLGNLRFVDARLGFAVGDSGRILKSADGGESWTPVPFPHGNTLNMVCFRDSAAGMVGTLDSAFLTADGGRTWSLLRGAETSAERITGFAMADARHLYVTEGFERFEVSADGGATWRDAAPGLPRGDAGTMAFPAPGVHYALGAEGAFLASFDAGATWEVRSYVPGPPWPPSRRVLSLSFSGPDTGFVHGDSGLVFSTQDGGRTWNQERLPGDGRVVWLEHASGSPAWAMTDEGDTWEYSATSTAIALSRPLPSSRASPAFALRGGRLLVGSDAPWTLRLDARDARGRVLWSLPRLQGAGRSDVPLPAHGEPYFLVIQEGGNRSVLKASSRAEGR